MSAWPAVTLCPRPSALVVSDITHAIGTEPVLGGISFTLARGEIGCLTGPSGCGKSTLLAMIGGMLHPSAGAVTHVFRHPVFVFQDPCLLPWRTARDNIAFGLKALPISRLERRNRAARLLDAVGLARDDGDKYPHELSGGMRQRIALARALAVEPDLLLLDEPFSALDIGSRRQMQDLVARLIVERDLTTVLVTHDLGEAVRLADCIFVMTPKPARIAAVHHVARAGTKRGETFVHAEISRLLAKPEVARALAVDDGGGAT
jgi:NitT/TauT family transport system ATP-binding protein